MPEFPAPTTDPSLPATEPARFQFAVTWSSLYVPVPGSRMSVVRPGGPHSRAVEKTPAQPNIAWQMVVPKMDRPVQRRRSVLQIPSGSNRGIHPVERPAAGIQKRVAHSIPARTAEQRIAALAALSAPPPVSNSTPVPRTEKPEPQPAPRRIPFQGIAAVSAAALASAGLTLFIVSHSSFARRASTHPQRAAVLHVPAPPVTLQSPPVPRSVPPAPAPKQPLRAVAAPRRSKSLAPPAPTVRPIVPDVPRAAPPPPPAEPPVPAPRPSAHFAADPIGMEDFQSSLVISKVKPVYPEVARLASVQGTVRLRATIGPDGSVQAAEAESGPPLLVQAAIDAVRQWKFLPARRNGQSVEDETHIDLSFVLVKPGANQ